MLTSLNKKDGEPLYLQIRKQIRDLILSGDLSAGTRLPPERELAVSLGVNRTTVSNAYQELIADGLVEGQVGRGTFVCSLPSIAGSGQDDFLSRPLPWSEYFVPVSEQGAEMDRPSTLYVEVDHTGEEVTAVRVGGQVAPMVEGVVRF